MAPSGGTASTASAWPPIGALASWRAITRRAKTRDGCVIGCMSFKTSLTGATKQQGITQIVLGAIASHRVGNRPARYALRMRKRRPKPYPLRTVPRLQACMQLAKAA